MLAVSMYWGPRPKQECAHHHNSPRRQRLESGLLRLCHVGPPPAGQREANSKGGLLHPLSATLLKLKGKYRPIVTQTFHHGDKERNLACIPLFLDETRF